MLIGTAEFQFPKNTKNIRESIDPAREARRENFGVFGAQKHRNIVELSHPAREARRDFLGYFEPKKH